MGESVLRLQKYRLVALNCPLAPPILMHCVSHIAASTTYQSGNCMDWQGYFRLHRVKLELETMGKDAVQLLVDSGKVAAAAQQSVRGLNHSLPRHPSCGFILYLAFIFMNMVINTLARRKTRAWQWRLRLNA